MMPSWRKLPAELKLMILEHVVDDVLRIPLEDDSWFIGELESKQRKLIAGLEWNRRYLFLRPMTSAERQNEMERYRTQHFETMRQQKLFDLHSYSSENDFWPVKKAIANFLAVAPDMKASLVAVLTRKQQEVLPSSRGALPGHYGKTTDRYGICQCNGARCGFVVKLTAWAKR